MSYRDDILNALSTGEASAKAIAHRIGVEANDIIPELRKLIGDETLEREHRGPGGYVYRLAGKSAPAAAQPSATAPLAIAVPAALTDELERLRAELATTLRDRDSLRAQLDAIPDIETKIAGYLVRVPKRKPAIVGTMATAVSRAIGAARGCGRAEVYALVRVGGARRGAEWVD